MLRPLVLALLLAAPAGAADRAGAFDYYVLSLSWSPTWCAANADRDRAGQCAPDAGRGFVVHGLWPQYEQGWPQDCTTAERDPSRRESQAMADLMGSAGLAWYQWRKHGRCSGLSAAGYHAATRKAAARVRVPAVFRDLGRDVTLPASVVEDAFIEANPGMVRDGLTVTCEGGRLDEVRICLTRDLDPRPCAPDSQRDCRVPGLRMDAARQSGSSRSR